ncbi:MAG: hypothetical protein ACLP4V_23065 [Methylocella sp.]
MTKQAQMVDCLKETALFQKTDPSTLGFCRSDDALDFACDHVEDTDDWGGFHAI